MAIIDNPTAYFQTKIYTGNGTTDTSITGVGFQPDMSWFKGRTNTENHFLFDSIRGATVRLIPNGTSTDATAAQSMKSFDSDGFTLGSDADVNQNSINFVSWNWKAGGTASSNTDGSITSSVSANQDAGFSIVSWTGDNSGSSTVGHGLGKIPNLVIVKNRTDASNWGVKHSSMTSGHMAVLNSTDPSSDRNGSTNGGLGNLTSSTTFGFIAGSAGTPEVNGSSDNMIAYCFTSIKGFSKFASYIPNGGGSDNTFIYLGFSPAFIMAKGSTFGSAWTMVDNRRSTHNVVNSQLFANSSGTEDNSTSNLMCDFLSNGFKIRSNNGAMGSSGQTYIYMAFAENPFVTSTGVPATAR